MENLSKKSHHFQQNGFISPTVIMKPINIDGVPVTGTLVVSGVVYIVVCQRGRVSVKLPWLQAITRHGPLTL